MSEGYYKCKCGYIGEPDVTTDCDGFNMNVCPICGDDMLTFMEECKACGDPCDDDRLLCDDCHDELEAILQLAEEKLKLTRDELWEAIKEHENKE